MKIMENKTIINLPGERPFALYDNRLFLSVGSNNASDCIIGGDMNRICDAAVYLMLRHAEIADIFVEIVRQYHVQREDNTKEI
jgi:hypothetical protein